jgi:hypothetical protein
MNRQKDPAREEEKTSETPIKSLDEENLCGEADPMCAGGPAERLCETCPLVLEVGPPRVK